MKNLLVSCILFLFGLAAYAAFPGKSHGSEKMSKLPHECAQKVAV